MKRKQDACEPYGFKRILTQKLLDVSARADQFKAIAEFCEDWKERAGGPQLCHASGERSIISGYFPNISRSAKLLIAGG